MMLVELQGTWLNHPVWVNPAHVKTLRPATRLEGQDHQGHRIRFCVAGQVSIEYAVDAGDGELHSDTVWGTLDEVAAKLNRIDAGGGAIKTDVFWKVAACTGWLMAVIAMGVVCGLIWGGWPL